MLAVSALLKFRDRRAMPAAMTGFGVPRRWAAPVATAVGLAEAALAGLLWTGVARPWPAWAAAGLLGVFTAAVVANLARDRRPPCPCFGAPGARPLSGRTVLRNGLLLALAVVAAG